MKYVKGFFLLSAIAFCLAFIPSQKVLAFSPYKIEALQDTSVLDDFVVGPGKTELEIEPGKTAVMNITLTNRMGEKKVFNISNEDFSGSNNPEETVVLLGNDKGPYSLKDYIHYEAGSVELAHGERATIPIQITVPEDAQPGGLYGSVLISTASRPDTNSNVSNAIVTRVGTLFFVKVPGPVKTEGKVSDFYVAGNKKVLFSGPITFNILYQNTGNIYLNPYGRMKVTNLMGSEVANFDIKPWFAMPSSTRFREINWDRAFLFGKYTATAEINRGYNNIVDTVSFSFWVIPILPIVLILLGILILVFIVKFFISRFEFRRKQ